ANLLQCRRTGACRRVQKLVCLVLSVRRVTSRLTQQAARWLSLLSSAALCGGCTFPDYEFPERRLGTDAGDGSLTIGGTAGQGTTTLGGSGGDFANSAGGTGGLGASSGSGAAGGSGGDTGTGGLGAGGESGGDGSGGAGSTGGVGVGGTGGSGGVGGSIGGSGGTAGTGGSGGTGGVDIGPCGNDLECISEQCDEGQCRPAHCGNAVLDPGETDVDCGGGDCRPCGYDQECQLARDCASASCTNDRCAPTLTVRCTCNSEGSCNQNPAPLRIDLQLTNSGPTAVALDGLTFHYYYSSDGAFGTDQATCNAVNFTGGSCTSMMLDVYPTGFDDPTASHEVRFRFTSGSIAAGTMTGAILFTIQGNGPYQRGNDYSFDGVPTNTTNFAPCDHVVVTDKEGVALWGIPPD